jgi:hypothetical protein
MTFSGSLKISNLFDKIDKRNIEEKLDELSAVLGIQLSRNTLDFLLINPILLKQVKLCDALSNISILNKSIGSSLSKYFAARELIEFVVPEYSLFDNDIEFPEEYKLISEIGAQGLYQYGINQFNSLKICCEDIVKFVLENSYSNICLVESPLGNVVPVQILYALFDKNNINVKKISLSLPRNDRSKFGFTFNEVITNNLDSMTNGVDLVIYIDDVISGSRFRKISSSLSKNSKNKSAKLVSYALVVKPHPIPNFVWKPDYKRNRSIIKQRAIEFQKENNFFPWFEIPDLPKFKIDDGLPVVYESPIVWGEQPIVAGMKKVNFIFNILEQFESILNDIITNEFKSRDTLLSLWSKDTKGVSYIIPDNILTDVFLNIREIIDWDKIKENAKSEFHADYSGGIDELQEEEVRLRWEWIKNEIFTQVKDKLGDSQANLLQKALHDLFTVLERHFPQARDSNYCNYFFKYNKSISRLNSKLISLIIENT